MNGHLLPSDTSWPDDNVLMAELSHLNTQVTRYILRYLDADAGRAEPISVDDEHTLGLKLAELGDVLQRRAARREATASDHGLVIENAGTQPRALESSRDPDLDDGP